MTPDLQKELNKLDKLKEKSLLLLRVNPEQLTNIMQYILTEEAKIYDIYNNCPVCQARLTK
jgi:hypothetical protein